MTIDSSQVLETAQKALHLESEALMDAASNLDQNFVKAVELLAQVSGKIILTGLGKSGHIARKIAGTLASTGSPAFFIHPSEALHGDLGMIHATDALVALAYGGETTEVIQVAKYAKRMMSPVVVITGNVKSTLAQLGDVVINGHVKREVCPLNLAPTASTTVAIALGDALAVSLMKVKGFSEIDFAGFHPGGSLGRKLSTVSDLMHAKEKIPQIKEEAVFSEVLREMTRQNFGVVAVMSHSGELKGVISDGDIRRALEKFGKDIMTSTASNLMGQNPKVVAHTELSLNALKKMEDFKITSLFVVNSEDPKRLLGIIRMHDLLTAKVV